MAFFMEENESFDPAGISLFGTVGVIFSADGIPYLVKQFLFGHQTPLDCEKLLLCYTLIIYYSTRRKHCTAR